MSRVAHDKYAFGQRSGGLLVVQRSTRLYMLEPNGDLDRADGVDGTDAGEVAAFLAGETLADGYDAEVGGSAVSYPLIADTRGAWPVTWHAPGTYDEYCPDDPVRPIRRWEAVAGSDLGGRELDAVEITVSPAARGATVGDLAGSALVVEGTGKPWDVRMSVMGFTNTLAHCGLILYLAESVGNTGTYTVVDWGAGNYVSQNNGWGSAVERTRRRPARTVGQEIAYKLQYQALNAGSVSPVAGTAFPLSLAVIER